MRRIRTRGSLWACAVLVPFLVGCPDRADDRTPAPATDVAAPAQPAAEQAPAELSQAADSYLQAWNGTDATAVARFYADDAMAMVGDSTYRGRDQIQQRWLSQSVQGITDLRTQNDRMEQSGTDWTQWGDYTYTATDPQAGQQQVTGTYRTTWTRAPAGEWRIREQEVRANAPPPTT